MKVAQDWKNKLRSSTSANPQVLKAKAAADATHADLMIADGDQQASLPFARSAMRQFGSIFDADKGNPAKARDYGQSANSADDKALKMNMLSEELSIFRTAEKTIRPQASKPDSEVEPLLDLARTMNGLGETLEKSKLGDEALASYREARQLLEQAAKREADNEDAAEGLADNLVRTARIGKETSGMAMAVEETERAVAILRRLVEKPGTKSEYRKQLAQALSLKGEMARSQRKGIVAKESFEESLGLWDSYGRLAGLKPEEEIEIGRLKTLAAK